MSRMDLTEMDKKNERKKWYQFWKKKDGVVVQELVPGILPGLPIPLPVLTDSYKASHYFQYPKAKKMVAYGEFRKAFQNDQEDQRLVCYGIRYIVQTYVARPWTLKDIEMAEHFFETHNAGFTKFPFPKDIFLKFRNENDGYFPVKIEALPEGTVCYPHTPIYQITAENEYSQLITYLETLLTMVWYPSTVATLSRRIKERIRQAYLKSVDEKNMGSLNIRLQDFGFRACTSVEQSVIGGCAHLLNFEGSDTMSASYYAQYHLNNGSPVGSSIPATEHSVMTSYMNERLAMQHMINTFGSGVYAIVMDSYDYSAALEQILPSVASIKKEKGGFLVLRPDSGEPVDVVLEALRAADKIFGSETNGKGFKVLKGVGVIQGDGLSYQKIGEILEKVMDNGFSVENVTFGMGGGLLQKVDRDTMSFATKLSFIEYDDSLKRNVMKAPITDPMKFSLPGEIIVSRNEKNVPTVYPKENHPNKNNELVVVYNKGPISSSNWPTFSEVKEKIEKEWLMSEPKGEALSNEMKELVKHTREEQISRNEHAIQSYNDPKGKQKETD